MVIFTPNTVIKSADVNTNNDELKTKTDYLTAPDSDWIAPTFQNSWVNFGSVWATAGYRKDAFGYVWLKGLIKSGTMPGTCFTLPAGYRPATNQRLRFACISNNALGAANVQDDGAVYLEVGSNAYFFLDNIRYKAEQ